MVNFMYIYNTYLIYMSPTKDTPENITSENLQVGLVFWQEEL